MLALPRTAAARGQGFGYIVAWVVASTLLEQVLTDAMQWEEAFAGDHRHALQHVHKWRALRHVLWEAGAEQPPSQLLQQVLEAVGASMPAPLACLSGAGVKVPHQNTIRR